MKIKEARNNYGHKGPFWYFTTHGVQPGSIPKGVHVLEIRDGRNDKGTMGTFVALDGVLTYDELREYDMKEMSPKINEGFEVTPQLVRELVDEYRLEAYGFNGIKDYVETQYPRHPEEFKKELIKKIKKAMNESLKEDTADSKINKGLREGLYDIYYDYEDEGGYIWRDNKEEFEGDWHELQDYINSMRRNGCYHIDAVYREGSSGEYDYELEEDIADNDIDKVYRRLSKLNKVDFGALEDEYLNQRPSVKDAVYKFYGTVLNMKSYCNDFAKWAKEEKGIDLKGIPCKKNEGLKEGSPYGRPGDSEFVTVAFDDGIRITARTEEEAINAYRKQFGDIDGNPQIVKDAPARSAKELDKIAMSIYKSQDIDDDRWYDFTDEELAILWSMCILTKENPWGRAYDDEVYDAINSIPYGSKIFQRAEDILDAKKNESLKEGMNKKDIAKKLVQLAYDYDYYDFMDSLEVGETMEDVIVRTERDLDNPKYVRGIIRWLKEVANDEYMKGDDIPQRAKRLIKELRGER